MQSVNSQTADIDPPICGYAALLSRFNPKRITKIFGIFMLIFGLVYPINANAQFVDIDNHKFSDSIEYIGSESSLSGFEGDQFKPYREITRAELAKILVTKYFTENEIGKCKTTNYTDVDENNSFLNYICIIEQNEILSGFPDGSFRPNAKLNIDDASKVILKFVMSVDPASLTDLDFEAVEHLNYMNHKKYVPSTIRCLDQNISRADAAEIVFRIANNDSTRPFKHIAKLKSCDHTFVHPMSHPTCVNSNYVSRGWSTGHTGIDYVLRKDSGQSTCTLISVGVGTVEKAGSCTSLGNCVIIKHNNGMRTLYAHMQPNMLVTEGETVDIGQSIGYMGSTGYSFGTHLHFSVSVNDTNVVTYRNRVNPGNLVPH